MNSNAELVELLPRLRRFALGLTGAPDLADDLVQAGCVKAMERWHQWTPGTSLASWMYRILQTTWIDEVRKSRRRPTVSDETVLTNLPGEDGTTSQEARTLLDQVMGEIRRLPEDQRIVLLLVSVDGMSYREAAETLQIPVGTVMSRLGRARARLADGLDL